MTNLERLAQDLGLGEDQLLRLAAGVVQAVVWYYANVEPDDQLAAARGAALDDVHREYRAEKRRLYGRGLHEWFNAMDAQRRQRWVRAALEEAGIGFEALVLSGAASAPEAPATEEPDGQ